MQPFRPAHPRRKLRSLSGNFDRRKTLGIPENAQIRNDDSTCPNSKSRGRASNINLVFEKASLADKFVYDRLTPCHRDSGVVLIYVGVFDRDGAVNDP